MIGILAVGGEPATGKSTVFKRAMVMLNGRQCNASATLKQGDRVVLVPDDVASLWRALGRSNLGLGIGYDS